MSNQNITIYDYSPKNNIFVYATQIYCTVIYEDGIFKQIANNYIYSTIKYYAKQVFEIFAYIM